jgi:hypothetical protein
MDGTVHTGSVSLGTVATSWNIVGAADFNGDGQMGILWQNSPALAPSAHERDHLRQQCLLRNRGDVLEHQKLLIVNAWRRSVASGM